MVTVNLLSDQHPHIGNRILILVIVIILLLLLLLLLLYSTYNASHLIWFDYTLITNLMH